LDEGEEGGCGKSEGDHGDHLNKEIRRQCQRVGVQIPIHDMNCILLFHSPNYSAETRIRGYRHADFDVNNQPSAKSGG